MSKKHAHIDLLQHPSWQNALGKLLFLICSAFLLGLIIQQPLLTVLVALTGYIFLTLYQTYRLQKWFFISRHNTPPPRYGIWSDVFSTWYQHNRTQQNNQRHNMKLLRAFRNAMHALPDGVIALDAQRRILRFNRAAGNLLSLSLKRDRGRLLADFLTTHPARQWLNEQPLNASIQDVPAPNNPQQRLSLRLVPYTPNQFLLIVRDLTHTLHLEQMRRDFIANVSHELRTPLTVLHGYLDLLDVDDLPQYTTILKDLRQQSQRMARIVDDLLTLSRLEANSDFHEEEIAIEALLNNLYREAEGLSQGRHVLTLSLTCKKNVLGSASDLHSAFSNLISNAIRYTPEGGTIKISWDDCPEGACFTVEDSGYGIPPEHLPRITERFYRVSNSRSRATGGTGLGLSIVKHALNRHQARLDIHSTLDKGSRFTCLFKHTQLMN